MQFIKYQYYKKVVYPKFIKNIDRVLAEKNILLRIKFDENKLTIYYVIDNKILKLEKQIENSLIYSEIELNELSSKMIAKDFIEIIQDFKLNADIVSSQNVIDTLSNSFRDAVSYYKLSRKEYQKIYESILCYKDFFKLNSPALVIHNEGVKNKWID